MSSSDCTVELFHHIHDERWVEWQESGDHPCGNRRLAEAHLIVPDELIGAALELKLCGVKRVRECGQEVRDRLGLGGELPRGEQRAAAHLGGRPLKQMCICQRRSTAERGRGEDGRFVSERSRGGAEALGASAWLEVSAGGARTVDREVHEEVRALLVEAAEGGAGKGCPERPEETMR